MKKILVLFTLFALLSLTLGQQTVMATNSSVHRAMPNKTIDVEQWPWESLVPYFDNSYDVANNTIEHVVVVINGTKRNADDYFDAIDNISKDLSTPLHSTYIVAPKFLTLGDRTDLGYPSSYLYWSSGGWKVGSKSKRRTNNTSRYSSYEVVDTLIEDIYNNNQSIKTITIVGHSAWGQFVQRFALTTLLHNNNTIKPMLRFVVANPSSYAYLDNRRFDTNTNQFWVPSTQCAWYDKWKYWLTNGYSYVRQTSTANIINNYEQAKVTYLLWENDIVVDSNLDVSCEANLQWPNRLERWNTYYEYIKDFFGISITNKHQKFIIPNVWHSYTRMFDSVAWREAIFQELNNQSTWSQVAYTNTSNAVINKAKSDKIYQKIDEAIAKNPLTKNILKKRLKRILSRSKFDMNNVRDITKKEFIEEIISYIEIQ